MAFFICSLRMGGSEKACIRLANALCNMYDVTVITIWGNAGLEKELDSKVRLIHKFPSYIRGIANISGRISPKLVHRFYIKEKYDIEIAVGDGLESHIVSGSNNTNIYSWCHINLGQYGSKNSPKAQKRYNKFKKIICVSEFNKSCFIKEMGFADKIRIAHTPMDLNAVLEKSKGTPAMAEKSLVTVGRLEKVKAIDRLVEAASAVNDSDLHLYIIGDGTQKCYIEECISKTGMKERIHLLGQMSNPYPYMAGAIALVCPSEEESFGFSIVEAMAIGTKVIATKCGGPEEIIRSPKEGLLCENTTEGICNAIKKVISNRDGIDIAQARKRAFDFDEDRCAHEFIDIIEER